MRRHLRPGVDVHVVAMGASAVLRVVVSRRLSLFDCAHARGGAPLPRDSRGAVSVNNVSQWTEVIVNQLGFRSVLIFFSFGLVSSTGLVACGGSEFLPAPSDGGLGGSRQTSTS